jgi:hypothetical protein
MSISIRTVLVTTAILASPLCCLTPHGISHAACTTKCLDVRYLLHILGPTNVVKCTSTWKPQPDCRKDVRTTLDEGSPVGDATVIQFKELSEPGSNAGCCAESISTNTDGSCSPPSNDDTFGDIIEVTCYDDCTGT